MNICEKTVYGTDTVHFVKTQNCDGIISAIRESADHESGKLSTQNSQKYLGSVPTLIAVAWAKEWGVRLHSKEWLEKARHRLKHDPDWRALRVGG